LAHISTDYVFDGDKGEAYVESDPVCPANAYGAAKALGEQAVLEGASRAMILRTSWVVSAHGKNFVKTMLRLAEQGGLRVVDD
ncbi:sugar nucleotide-binding protein, partial [Pseudomonas sp. FW306-02-F08-AA]|uniref:SDR family oxidoreductase n=1 Tax=Pseudomonas sp. FW306-02-F08-AA TaxID=2070651 RepID=UPI000CB932A3